MLRGFCKFADDGASSLNCVRALPGHLVDLTRAGVYPQAHWEHAGLAAKDKREFRLSGSDEAAAAKVRLKMREETPGCLFYSLGKLFTARERGITRR